MDSPKTPRAKRAANDKWDRENMTTLGCKVKKEEATAFKAYCVTQGKTSNNVLKEFVLECIGSECGPDTQEGDAHEPV